MSKLSKENLRNLLESIWGECEARSRTPRSKNCSKFVTHEIFSVKMEKKFIKATAALDGLSNISFVEKTKISQGKFCKECVEEFKNWLAHVHYDETFEIQQIPWAEDGLKFLK